jgi:hypothetical protein
MGGVEMLGLGGRQVHSALSDNGKTAASKCSASCLSRHLSGGDGDDDDHHHHHKSDTVGMVMMTAKTTEKKMMMFTHGDGCLVCDHVRLEERKRALHLSLSLLTHSHRER